MGGMSVISKWWYTYKERREAGRERGVQMWETRQTVGIVSRGWTERCCVSEDRAEEDRRRREESESWGSKRKEAGKREIKEDRKRTREKETPTCGHSATPRMRKACAQGQRMKQWRPVGEWEGEGWETRWPTKKLAILDSRLEVSVLWLWDPGWQRVRVTCRTAYYQQA